MLLDVAEQGEGLLGLEEWQVGADEEALFLELGAQLGAMVGCSSNAQGEQKGYAGIQAAGGIVVHGVVASRRRRNQGAPQLAAADDYHLLNMGSESGTLGKG